MATTGIKFSACVPSRRGDTAVSQHKIQESKLKSIVGKQSSLLDTQELKISKTKTYRAFPAPVKEGRDILSLMTAVESKSRIVYTDGPTRLGTDSVMEYFHTKESSILVNTMNHIFGDKLFRARLGTILNMSSSGGGIVNSTIATSTLGSVTEFASFQALFNEFFLQNMKVTWQPLSLYNGPMTYLPATTVASLPIGVVDLQHGQNAYTSMTLMADNPHIRLENTGKAFIHTWHNVEDHRDTSLPYVTGAAVTQSWCQVSNTSFYSGQLQFISQSAPPGLPVSSVLGSFLVEYDVYFRNRY
jgi:hypothetical protein